jgi:hypothetical protein
MKVAIYCRYLSTRLFSSKEHNKVGSEVVLNSYIFYMIEPMSYGQIALPLP